MIMMGKPCSDKKAIDLLNQLDFILESDPLIDEVGFVHPSQFVTLSKEGISSTTLLVHGNSNNKASGDEAMDHEYGNFWNRDHKLGISSQILVPLYGAAKLAFMAAIREYKTFIRSLVMTEGENMSFTSLPCDSLERNIMKHSRALLLLSSDFGTAWNSRKLIVSKKQQLLVFMDELLLSELVLSYSPKSEQAWTHRRWVIRMIAGKCSTLEDIIAKESELVEKIAERSKMNYRAWNHRCWLVSYMSREQMLYELKKSRGWAGLHVADHSCYHYRRRLMVGILESSNEQEENSSYNIGNNEVLKEELNWNELLIKRYIGREALWLHRRFLSSYWIRHMESKSRGSPHHTEQKPRTDNEIDIYINSELSFVNSCSAIQDSEFEDFSAQATYSALYLLWLIKHVPQPQRVKLREKLEAEGNFKILLKKTYMSFLLDSHHLISKVF